MVPRLTPGGGGGWGGGGGGGGGKGYRLPEQNLFNFLALFSTLVPE